MDKKCCKCHIIKPCGEFNKNRSTKDGLAPTCKQCRSEEKIIYRDKIKTRMKAYCQKRKDIQRVNHKEWQEKNRDDFNEYRRGWSAANIDRMKEYNRYWRKKNKDKVKGYKEKYIKARPERILSVRMGRVIRGSLTQSTKAGRSWQLLVGYTASELKNHIEKQFLPGMSWDNRSEWHIDHIIPISAFNYNKPEDVDFKRCWALNNLRPLWKEDNIKKSNKLDKPFQPYLSMAI